MSRGVILAAGIAALMAPLPASAFTAKNGMVAVQISPTEIAVPHDSRGRETDYWCAAGDFADRVMRVDGATRMWRASPKPREAGVGITFTLDPAKKAEGAGLSSFGSGPKDGSISVSAAAGNHCRKIWPFIAD
ncbi:hypothetical protein MLD63_05215 [Paracoccus sp. TK19116]|uniref:Uncharacterized protein n=1 Tax=Paracoccus albicereus TaxID=2922394 RepID=A0ABT1MNH3_9RHOB|nr:hypothetical protein [Paracoccus albicereus]MCQ0969827.1 hypothetical protein [Paracoccus albicereus]